MSKAKILKPEEIQEVVVPQLKLASERPAYDVLLVQLSFKAALRACEMRGLKWRDVTDARAAIVGPGALWEVPAAISKYGGKRDMPMHEDLWAALVEYRDAIGPERSRPHMPLMQAEHAPTQHISANALQRYMGRMFRRLGYQLSSHSGRRSFLTTLSRRLDTHGCSLRDLQKLAGHRSLAHTETYLELSPGAVGLVASL